MKKSTPFNAAEIALAKRLFAEAQAEGSLKKPRAIGAVASRAGGPIRSMGRIEVTHRDYLRDARAILSAKASL